MRGGGQSTVDFTGCRGRRYPERRRRAGRQATTAQYQLRGLDPQRHRQYRPLDAASLLRRNLLIYGVGGIIVPFPGIWAIDQLLVLFHLA